MSPVFAVDSLARRIAQASAERTVLQLSPQDCPPDLDTAEAVLFGATIGTGKACVAWKLGASTHASRAAQGFDRAWSAPFFATEVLPSPARLPARADGMLGLECELIFHLGQDMPLQGPLDPASVRPLVATVCAGIEVPASRYPAIGAYGAPALVADRGAAGWLVTGDETADWTPAELDIAEARLLVDGAERGAGSGGDLIEGPFGALCDHLRRMQAHGIAQPAGTLVSIGSLAGFVVLQAPCTAVADFGRFGRATLAILPPE